MHQEGLKFTISRTRHVQVKDATLTADASYITTSLHSLEPAHEAVGHEKSPAY